MELLNLGASTNVIDGPKSISAIKIGSKLNSRPFAPKIRRVFLPKSDGNCLKGSFQWLELNNLGAPRVIEGP